MGSPVPVDTSISQVLNPWNGGGGDYKRQETRKSAAKTWVARSEQ